MKKFNDLVFQVSIGGGVAAVEEFDNGLVLSVVAGRIAYSTPREDDLDSSQYSSFEVAILDSDGEFVTRDILQIDNLQIDSDVLGWQGREEINNIMEIIQLKNIIEISQLKNQ
jgi:hypothetical protein